MIRHPRPRRDPPSTGLATARRLLLDRRRFLIAAAGGSLALLFGARATPDGAGAETATGDPWATLDPVLQHLLPSEAEAPGALEIHAVDYLRGVVTDTRIDADERAFIVQGAGWLDDLARQRHGRGFGALDWDAREALLRQTAAGAVGENWIATLLTYLFEALLTAPVYGGNPDGIGWRWLEVVPGFPLPGPGTRHWELPT